jgi:predicted transposase YdaD
MKRNSIKTQRSQAKPSRGASDNLCKRLAEEYPAPFALWLFGANGKVKVEKTEMSREPIRADSVIFSSDEQETLHIEFQTSMKSDLPVPLRMLDYYIGLKRKNPDRRVRQSLVVLKPTDEPIPDRYTDERTTHSYDVVRLWEVDPAELLRHEGLLPLATLARAQSGEKLLSEVAERIRRIASRERRREALNWSRVLAGLRYDKGLIIRILKESDMLEESVIYQDIFQKGERRGEQRGEQRGLQEGAMQEARKVALRQLEIRFGNLSVSARRRIERLDLEQLEGLCEDLLDFKTRDDLTRWLKQHAPDRRRNS